jgi:hypothetical protein
MHASILASMTLLAGAGCSKASGGSSSASTSASAATAGATPAACADRVASFNPKATASDKTAYAAACSAISAKAQTCIASAKQDKDVDACLVDKADKDAFMGAALVAAFQGGTAAPQGVHTTKLDKLGVQLDAPGEALVSDGIGPKSAMIIDAAVGGLSVGEAPTFTAKTLKAAKSEAQMFKPHNLQGQEIADGYWLTFENTGSLGTNYWVKTVHRIGKKTFTCDATSDTAEKSSAALTACKTLRAI